MAALIGFALGVAGGVLLGRRYFDSVQPQDFSHLEAAVEGSERVSDHPSMVAIPPEVRAILPFMPDSAISPDFEQANWANLGVERLWPGLRKAINRIATKSMRETLTNFAKKRPWLEAVDVDEFDLGPIPARFGGMKVTNTRDDEVIMEAPLIFGSHAKLTVAVWLRAGPFVVYVPISATNASLKGTLRATVRPLVDTLPCLGAVTFTVVDTPYVDLVLKAVTDKIDLMAIPFVHSFGCLLITKLIEGICVYPNEIPVPIMRNSGLTKPPCGILEIHVDRIVQLRGKADIITAADPFVRMSVVDINLQNGKVMAQGPPHETRILNGRNPVFNETLRLLVTEMGQSHAILIEVYDYDIFNNDNLMAIHNLPLDDSPETEHRFFRQPGQPDDVLVLLEEAPVKGGFGIAKMHRVLPTPHSARRGESMGDLHLSVTYIPLERPEGEDIDDHNPAAAMEADQMRRASHEVGEDSKGVLTVKLMRCRDLPTVRGACDSYVELRVDDPDREQPETRRTKVTLNETSPVYRVKYEFVEISSVSTFTATVFHKYGVFEVHSVQHALKPWAKRQKAIGKVTIPVRDIVRVSHIKDAWPLEDAMQGVMHLTFDWLPIQRKQRR